MISDTIVALVMFIIPVHQPQNHCCFNNNRFEKLFHEADSAFEAKYQLNEKLKKELERAVKEAAISADRKTARQREEVMRSLPEMLKVVEDLKNQSIYNLKDYESK